MSVVTVVITGLDNLDVGLGQLRFLGELVTQIVECNLQVTAEKPAYKTQSKHIAALENGLGIHATVRESIFYHLGKGACNYAIRINSQLSERILSLESGFLKVCLLESVCINDNSGVFLGVLELCLESGGIHCYQNITLIARGINFTCADVYLKTRNAGK